MVMKKFSFRIASDTRKVKVFAEIFYDNDQWAEISQEEKAPVVTFFSPSNSKYWEFDLEDALEILQLAKNSLINEK